MVNSSMSAQLQSTGEVIGRELNLIGTSYGQLVYLAGMLDPNTGRYNHFAMSATPENDFNQLCRRKHEAIFQHWVAFPLEKKMADLELYISSLAGVNRAELVDAWLRLTPYKYLVPASIQGPERRKHVSDFEAILGLLKNVYGVASPNPNS